MGGGERTSAVEVAAVGCTEYQYDQPFVFDATDEAVGADAVAPHARAVVTQRATETPGIRVRPNPFGQVAEDGLLRDAIEPPKLATGTLVPSTFQINLRLQVLVRPSSGGRGQSFLGQMEVFEVLEVGQDRLACMEGLGASGPAGQFGQTLLDLPGQPNRQHVLSHAVLYVDSESTAADRAVSTGRSRPAAA